METKIFESAAELEPGWYAVGVKDIEDEINWQCAPLYKYLGDECWVDECGEVVEDTWDSVIQMRININSADAYMQQT